MGIKKRELAELIRLVLEISDKYRKSKKDSYTMFSKFNQRLEDASYLTNLAVYIKENQNPISDLVYRIKRTKATEELEKVIYGALVLEIKSIYDANRSSKLGTILLKIVGCKNVKDMLEDPNEIIEYLEACEQFFLHYKKAKLIIIKKEVTDSEVSDKTPEEAEESDSASTGTESSQADEQEYDEETSESDDEDSKESVKPKKAKESAKAEVLTIEQMKNTIHFLDNPTKEKLIKNNITCLQKELQKLVKAPA